MEENSGINRIVGIIGIIFLALGMIALLIYDHHQVPQYTYVNIGRGSRDTTKELGEGVLIIQEVPYYAGDMGLSFRFTTYGHRVSGEINVRAVGLQSGSVYLDQTIPGKNFKNNEYADFFFSEGISGADETLAVTFTATSEPGSGLAILTTGMDSIPDRELMVDGEISEADLMLRRVVTDAGKVFPLIILGIVLGLGISAAVILILRKPPLETAALILTLFSGILYMFIMTPFAIPDEDTHYRTSFYLSNFILFRDKEAGEAQYFDFTGFPGHLNARSGYDRITTDFFKPSEPDGTVPIRQYSLPYPLMYLPQAAGISLGRLLRLNFLMTFYLGRFFNLLFFAACVYFAVRHAPRFRLLFCLSGMMPMALHQAASYSYDTFINGLSILFIALILRLREGEGRMRFTEIIPALLTGILVCPAKPVYAPLLLLFVLIPIRRFGSIRKWLFTMAAVAVLAGSAVAFSRIGSISALLAIPDQPSVTEADGSAIEESSGSGNYNASFILSHPGQTAKIFLDTIRTNETWLFWLKQSVGWLFAGMYLKMYEWQFFAYFLLMLIASFPLGSEKCVIWAKERCLMLFISAAVIGLVMLVMFVGWTPHGDPIIQGVQGRYFMPILPLFFMCCSNRLITVRTPIEKVLIGTGLFINLSVLNQILLQTM